MFEPLLYLAGTMLVTAILAVFVCRHCVARHKRITWAELVGTSLTANMLVAVSLIIYEEGWDIFSRDAWSGGKGGWGGIVVVLGIISILCILPAQAVALCYQRPTKNNEKPTV